jgi:nicotinate-nucleotide adenylyltransferase
MAHILLYGGTFDPIHLGHLIPSRAAKEFLAGDSVLFLPARLSPHKQNEPPGATAQQRLEMIRLAISGEKDFDVDPREFNRGDPSYTIDTIRELKRDRPQDRFTLLIGADQLTKLHTWHEVRQIFAEVSIAVVIRGVPGVFLEGIQTVTNHLGAPLAESLSLCPTPSIDVSSTNIRYRVARNQPISYLVPAPVASYIHENWLYQKHS